MKTIKLFILFCTLACMACQSNEKETDSLNGTKWKLAGIVENETDSLSVLEPTDCGECYTLVFDTDNTFSTFSSTNELMGNYIVDYETYSIHIINFGGTKLGEIGDGELYYNIWHIVQSFSLEKNKLKLYYEDKKYMLYNQLND